MDGMDYDTVYTEMTQGSGSRGITAGLDTLTIDSTKSMESLVTDPGNTEVKGFIVGKRAARQLPRAGNPIGERINPTELTPQTTSSQNQSEFKSPEQDVDADLAPISELAREWVKKVQKSFTDRQIYQISRLLDSFAVEVLDRKSKTEIGLAQMQMANLVSQVKGIAESIDHISESSEKNEGALLSMQRFLSEQQGHVKTKQTAEIRLEAGRNMFASGVLAGIVAQSGFPVLEMGQEPSLRDQLASVVVSDINESLETKAIAERTISFCSTYVTE